MSRHNNSLSLSLSRSSLFFFSFLKFMFLWFWFHFCSYKVHLILLIYVSFSISFILFQWFWYVGGCGIGWVWSWDRLWAPYVCEYASKRNRETNLFEFLELYDFLGVQGNWCIWHFGYLLMGFKGLHAYMYVHRESFDWQRLVCVLELAKVTEASKASLVYPLSSWYANPLACLTVSA